MRKIKSFFAVVALLLTGAVAFAQNAQVSGTVKDANGDVVSGAAVQLKGSTTTYAMTDALGGYKISVPSDGVLVVSCLGYKTAEIAVGGRKVVDVLLEVDSTVLDETIVVAYGSVKREAVTGSVSSVKGETLASAPVTSVDKALGGKLAGVQVSGSSGQPGAASNIRIRGYSSINASNEPLWVVDGIPVLNGNISELTNTSNTLATLNPNDIESITVLKDAAAAAAYGSRAANGVILVTTKSGKEGKASFDVRAKFGVNWLQNDSGFRPMTAEELLGFQRQATINAGLNPDDPTGTYYLPLNLLNGEHSNWLNYLLRLGKQQEYEISARGGNQKSKYFSSLSFHRNEGVFYGVDYQKFQARVNADHKLTNKLEASARVNVAYTEQNDIPMQSLYYANPAFAGLTLLPWIPKEDENGLPNVNIPSNSYQNPRATAMFDQQWEKIYRFNGTFGLKWEPVKNLFIETKNSAEGIFGSAKRYWDPQARGKASDPTDQSIKNQYVQLTTSNTITYSNTFGGYHNLRAVVGQEAMKYMYDYMYTYAPGTSAEMPFPQFAPAEKVEAEMGFSRRSMLSFFGIADYNYDQKYFGQVTLRTDGSSLFGSKNKWGLFWSVSGSWNMSNENWLHNVSWIDLLKIRASYGINGNNGISPYQAYGLYGGTTYNGYVGMLPSQPANDILSWEKNATWNVGLDFGFLNRIRGSVDVYSRKTLDMLLDKTVPQTTGYSSLFMNIGSMKNEGVEFQIDGDIFQSNDFVWNVGFNIAFNKTTILDLGGEQKIGSFLQQVVGKSMYTYYVYDYYGVNPTNGQALWVASVDEETGEKTLTSTLGKARKYYAGSPEPTYMGGFNTSLEWKGLSFSAFFEYMGGNKVLNVNEYHYINNDGGDFSMNQKASALNYWKNPGDTGCNPKPIAGNSTNSDTDQSDRWMERGDFLRIKDVTLSYSFQKPVLDALHLKGLKVYVSGLNLYCFNDVDFWDPQISLVGYGAGNYPLTKSIIGGIEVSF
ncbi:MAG: TonB-dependent receptor [Bacteroidales bacterium]|nr:TonB-dependent receptor [Bacteroidales bacterium]